MQRRDQWLSEAGSQGWAKMDQGGQKVYTSSYKINKAWGCKVQHADYS